MDAKTYFQNSSVVSRVCVPAYERIKQLYAFGYSNAQISEALQSEFHDIEYNSMTPKHIHTIVNDNLDEFNKARMDLGIKCREEIQHQIQMLFRATENVECHMVSIFVRKMRQALNQLETLDLEQKDDMGNYVNTSRVFVLIEMVEKFQKSIAKIVGTDALREVEIFRQKANLKTPGDKGLIPAFANNKIVEAEPITNFVQ